EALTLPTGKGHRTGCLDRLVEVRLQRFGLRGFALDEAAGIVLQRHLEGLPTLGGQAGYDPPPPDLLPGSQVLGCAYTVHRHLSPFRVVSRPTASQPRWRPLCLDPATRRVSCLSPVLNPPRARGR